MSVIMALLLFNCTLHLNQKVCIQEHVSCIETMSSTIKGELHLLTLEERIAASYVYCIRSGGEVGSWEDFQSILDMFEKRPLNLDK